MIHKKKGTASVSRAPELIVLRPAEAVARDLAEVRRDDQPLPYARLDALHNELERRVVGLHADVVHVHRELVEPGSLPGDALVQRVPGERRTGFQRSEIGVVCLR
jgi:hypothetical protein